MADNPALDYRDRTPAGYGYCVFGEVIEGLDVVDKIGSAKVHDTQGLRTHAGAADRRQVDPASPLSAVG